MHTQTQIKVRLLFISCLVWFAFAIGMVIYELGLSLVALPICVWVSLPYGAALFVSRTRAWREHLWIPLIVSLAFGAYGTWRYSWALIGRLSSLNKVVFLHVPLVQNILLIGTYAVSLLLIEKNRRNRTSHANQYRKDAGEK